MYKFMAPLASVCLLAGIGVDKAMRENVSDSVEAYHARVLEATQHIPYTIGDWVGVDTEIRKEALRILNPNVALSRTYRNVQTGHSATLVLVHCRDARDLLGHYPPVCYPSQGWTKLSVEPCNVQRGDTSIRGSEYSFAFDTLGESARLGVFHFTVLPEGQTAPTMDALDRSARDRTTRTYGGASVQFIVDANLPESERRLIYESLADATIDWLHSFGTEINNQLPLVVASETV